MLFSNSFATSILAQNSVSDSLIVNSNLENNKVEETMAKANSTFENAQNTYKAAEKYMEYSKELDQKLFNRLGYFFAVVSLILTIAGISIYSSIRSYKNVAQNQINNLKEKLSNDIIKELSLMKTENEVLIKRLIDTENWGERLREKSQVVVLNQEKTKMGKDFTTVMRSFGKYKKLDVNFLIDTQNFDADNFSLEISKLLNNEFGLIVLEDSDGGWSPFQGSENKKEINDLMVRLAKSLCPSYGLFYLGKGRFPIDEIKDRKIENMISYANAPAQLYGNMMNMLKYQDILKNS